MPSEMAPGPENFNSSLSLDFTSLSVLLRGSSDYPAVYIHHSILYFGMKTQFLSTID